MDDAQWRCGTAVNGGISSEAALLALQADDRFRILRRVEMPDRRAVCGPTEGSRIGACLDTETSGLDPDVDRIIELAIRLFRFDGEGRIVALDAPYAWLEDPGMPLNPTITRITGLKDEDVAGHAIDTDAAVQLLGSASLVIAHHSRFDREFVERRLPGANGLSWSCSMEEVDWAGLGYEGRTMRWLLDQAGWFYEAHRAGDDVDALIQLLRHELPDGATVLSHVVRASERSGWLVRTHGAHYDRRHVLKERGYSWDGSGRVWLREVADGELDGERLWLQRNVYDPTYRPKAGGPVIDRIDATNRYRRLQ